MSEHTGQAAPDDGGPASADKPRFRLGYVPGATPSKWARTWEQRLRDVPLELVLVESADVSAALTDRALDAAVGRLPVDMEVFHAIALYTEIPVVVVGRDHLLAATEETEHVTLADLADDVLWVPGDDVLFTGSTPRPGQEPEAYDDGTGSLVRPAPGTTAEAIAWAAAGTGAVVVPMSLARLHRRKDVVQRVLTDGPQASVGLVWLRDGLSEETRGLVEEMVGIVRGRTANSSRGTAATPPAVKGAAKKVAKGASSATRRGAPRGGRRGASGGGKGRGKRR